MRRFQFVDNLEILFLGRKRRFFCFSADTRGGKTPCKRKPLINKVPIVSLCFMIQIIVTINNKIRIKDDIKIVILTFLND